MRDWAEVNLSTQMHESLEFCGMRDHAGNDALFDLLFLLGLPIWIPVIRLYDSWYRRKLLPR
jgi:hypothetical protein